MIKELLLPKYYVKGKNDRELLGQGNRYKKLNFTKLQALRKEREVTTYTEKLKEVKMQINES